ncbi:MAG TPA: lipase maturation factor family protein, partial [Thermoanaerobaculia bacterium]|nr:lipase maturation factor family protein [Thermoanaerobaculia bacterium]
FDWNLWFASLGQPEDNPFVMNTESRLMEGSPQVLELFAGNPFAGKPPIAVRAVLWQYWFTTRAERARTGAWWNRRLIGLYAP